MVDLLSYGCDCVGKTVLEFGKGHQLACRCSFQEDGVEEGTGNSDARPKHKQTRKQLLVL